MSKSIGFVTRFVGSDGVSLECKMAEVLWDDEHVSFWYSGRNDRDPGFATASPKPILAIRRMNGLMSASGGTIAEIGLFQNASATWRII